MNLLGYEVEDAAGRCRCCLIFGSFKDLWAQYVFDGETEVYGDMLAECFSIDFRTCELEASRDQICDTCVARLRDAHKFRKLVLTSQEQLTGPTPYLVESLDDTWMHSNVKSEPAYQNVEYLDEHTLIQEENKHNNNERDCTDRPEADQLVFLEIETEFADTSDNFAEMEEEILDETIFDNEALEEDSRVRKSAIKITRPIRKENKKHTTAETSIDMGNESVKNETYHRESDEDFQESTDGTVEYEKKMKKCIEAIAEGLVNVNRAEERFGLSRRCIIGRLKEEFGSKYKEVANRWKYRVSPDSNRKYTEEDVLRTMRDIIDGNVNLYKAARAQHIPFQILIRRLKDELGDSYKETIGKMRAMKKRKGANVSKTIKAQIKPSKQAVLNAVKAVKEGRMTYSGAQKVFNVSSKFLRNVIKHNIDVKNKDIDAIYDRRKDKSVPIEMLKRCVRLAEEGQLTPKEASCIFNIPYSVILYRMRRGFLENAEEKRRNNRKGTQTNMASTASQHSNELFSVEERLTFESDVKTILSHTNATPFLVLRGKALCAYCAQSIEDPEDLRRHTLKEHSEERLDKIPEFLRPAEEKEIIRMDIENLHCVKCSEEIERWDELFLHLQSVHKVTIEEDRRNRIIPFVLQKYTWRCVLCNERAGNLVLLEFHMNKHYDNYICHECGENFMCMLRLKTHMYQKTQLTGEYSCDQCGVVLTGKVKYKNHLSTVHKVPLRCPCKYCGERFNERYPRHLHMMEMHREKVEDITCVCGKVFQWKPFYVSHFRQMHIRERNYTCPHCSKAFLNSSTMKRHVKIHTGQRDFHCKVCNKRFYQGCHLRAHMKLHKNVQCTDVDNYVIRDCDSDSEIKS